MPPTKLSVSTRLIRICPHLAVMEELMRTGHFGNMDTEVDEDEHSIEMQLPYLAKIFEGCEVSFSS